GGQSETTQLQGVGINGTREDAVGIQLRLDVRVRQWLDAVDGEDAIHLQVVIGQLEMRVAQHQPAEFDISPIGSFNRPQVSFWVVEALQFDNGVTDWYGDGDAHRAVVAPLQAFSAHRETSVLDVYQRIGQLVRGLRLLSRDEVIHRLIVRAQEPDAAIGGD